MLRKVCPIAAPSYMLLNAPTVSFMFCTIKKKKDRGSSFANEIQKPFCVGISIH